LTLLLQRQRAEMETAFGGRMVCRDRSPQWRLVAGSPYFAAIAGRTQYELARRGLARCELAQQAHDQAHPTSELHPASNVWWQVRLLSEKTPLTVNSFPFALRFAVL